MLRLMMIFVPLCCLALNALSQPKTLIATKVSHAPRIDGELNDAVWQQASPVSGFVQNFPTFGLPATSKTEVRIIYDDNAIYIGAYMYDNPSDIHRQITARDDEQQQDVDYFSVFLDTYDDQQNGFQFLVTTANVQTDAKLNGTANASYGQFGDRTWDAAWESQVKMKADGWTAEMMIPYSSIRFSKRNIQTWGLQLLRFTRRNNEVTYWNPVNPVINGFGNQFGKLLDITNIRPPLRLSFSPYLSTGVRYNPDSAAIRSIALLHGGMDVKYGINESFTLDATLIPDFGEVVSDNIINNLSPFEVRFQENRPFFTEGTELFNKSGLFYSRRVGAIPGRFDSIQAFVGNNPNFELIRNPTITQLYNGIKFSGRTKKKLGIGIFNAVTAPMTADIREIFLKKDSLIQTEPMTNYNLIVLDQALKGRSSVTFTNANVIRQGNYRNANVSAFDWALYTRNNKFQFMGTGRYSKIFGYTPYVEQIFLISDTVRRQGLLYIRPYQGYNTTVRLGKVSGNLQYYISNNITSGSYDPNDLGYLQRTNQVNYNAGISYHQYTPVSTFISYVYSLDLADRYLYKPNVFTETEIIGSGYWLFKNFWDFTFTIDALPQWQNDYFELRTPGKFVKKPSEVFFNVSGNTDSRKALYAGYFLGYAVRPVQDDPYFRTTGSLRYRFSERFSLALNISRQQENNQVGYAFIRESNADPVIGKRRFIETISILTGIYNFTSRLNLSLRARHYWNLVHYNNFYDVASDGNYIPRPFIAGQDQNYNVFNLDAFLTWDFRLGSRMILGWKNWLGNSYGIDGANYNSYLLNLGKTFGVSHGNEFTFKIIYYLDYNQLRKTLH